MEHESADPPVERVDHSSFPPFLLLFPIFQNPIPSFPNLRPPGGRFTSPLTPLLGPSSASVNWSRAPLGLPLVEYYRFFVVPTRHRKIYNFFNRRKAAQMALSSNPASSKDGFLTKKHDLRHPFLHQFIDFFRKWQNCEISEEYNAKRGFEPPTSFDVRIDFSSNFNEFSKHPSRYHFSRDPARI